MSITVKTTKSIHQLLIEKFDATTYPGHFTEWILATEVGNATGYGRNRSLDAIGVNCFPSKGLEIHGFEVKASKSDLMTELQNPSKSRTFYKNLDFFSLVCPAVIVDKEIIPRKWGIYTPNKDFTKLRCVRKPLPLHDEWSTTLDKDFTVALMRAFAVRGIGKEEAAEHGAKIAKERYQRKIESIHLEEKRSKERAQKRHDDFCEVFEERNKRFKEATGKSIDSFWDGAFTELIRTAALLREVGIESAYRDLLRTSKDLEQACNNLEKLVDVRKDSADGF